MEWQKLDRQETAEVLAQIRASDQGRLFTGNLIEVKFKSLPFYKNYLYYRITNYATMPMFSMDYLGQDSHFYYLEGTADPIYTVNRHAPLRLTPDNVPAYLEFFFEHVSGRQGDVHLITDPRNSRLLRSLDKAALQSIVDKFQPLRVEYESSPDKYLVGATLYYDGSLISALLSIAPDGHVYLEDERMLLQGVSLHLNKMYA